MQGSGAVRGAGKGLAWLVGRAAGEPGIQSVAHAVLEYLASATGADLTAMEYQPRDGERSFTYFSERVVTPADLNQVRDSDGRAFRTKHVSGRLFSDAPEDVTGPALAVLELCANLESASREAAIDPLTGLANRRALAEGLGAAIGRGNRYGTSFSLVMLDLDGFKWFNDTYGHTEGDLLLRRLAQVLVSTVRAADLAARYGGDEFVLVLPHTEPSQADVLLDRVRSELDDFLQDYRRPDVRLGISAGTARFPDDGTDADTLQRRADERLYQDKNRQR